MNEKAGADPKLAVTLEVIVTNKIGTTPCEPIAAGRRSIAETVGVPAG